MPRPEALEAIRKSITHWVVDIRRPLGEGRKTIKLKEHGEPAWADTREQLRMYVADCPLCQLYDKDDTCDHCPLYNTEGSCGLGNTPYNRFYNNPTLGNANGMIKALVKAYKHEKGENAMKCPKCGREISTLKNIEMGTMEYDVGLDVQGDVEYRQKELDVLDTDIGDVFRCPKCDEVLFDDEDDAIKFLKGGKV